MALHSRYAITVSAVVATRSRADCSSMEGHTSLSTVLVICQQYYIPRSQKVCVYYNEGLFYAPAFALLNSIYLTIITLY